MTTDSDAAAPGSTEPDAAGSELDTGMFGADVGWTTAKVVLLVVAAAFVAIVLAFVVSDRVSTPSADSVEVGFLQDMIHHHEQAIQLGVIGTSTVTDPDVSHFALEAVIVQQYEIGYMEAILEEWGHGTGDRDRDAMAWMDMPTTLENMPGMASDEQMREYRDLTGAEADAAFLRLMTEHHRGGVHMAEYARDHASDERVAGLAERMVRNQTAEINEYASQARRLGIGL